ncbi:MAG: hypothetical protein Q6J68_05730 [Thermostichales cyanobacterium SZTDM-1c_bins_54]
MSEDPLSRIEQLVQTISQQVEANSHAIAQLGQQMEQVRQDLKEEVRRWDERFCQFAQDTANPANTLIANTTIAVIAGVLLLILKQP